MNYKEINKIYKLIETAKERLKRSGKLEIHVIDDFYFTLEKEKITEKIWFGITTPKDEQLFIQGWADDINIEDLLNIKIY